MHLSEAVIALSVKPSILTLFLLVSSAHNIGKQTGPRSGSTKRRA